MEHQLALYCILEVPAWNLSHLQKIPRHFLQYASAVFFNPSKFIIHSQYLIERRSKVMHLTEIRELTKTQQVDNQACSERGVDADK